MNTTYDSIERKISIRTERAALNSEMDTLVKKLAGLKASEPEFPSIGALSKAILDLHKRVEVLEADKVTLVKVLRLQRDALTEENWKVAQALGNIAQNLSLGAQDVKFINCRFDNTQGDYFD